MRVSHTPKTVRHADGRDYPQKVVVAERIPEVAATLTEHGYGVPAARVEEILRKLTPEDVADLMYVCYRAADKIGPDAFLLGE